MKRLKAVSLLWLLSGLMLLFAGIAAGHPVPTIAAGDAPPVTLPDTELLQLHSEFTGRDYRLYIALPADYATSNRNYPVIYLLDAQSTFATVTEYTRRMSFFKELPAVIVVGIGYTTDSTDEIVALRVRDLTPSDPGGTGQAGGADRFLSFITDEAIPFVESRYRVDPQDRALVGHSLGGLFALYTLFTQPQRFQRYVASSPSLWWDKRFMFDYEAHFAQTHQQVNARLYIAAGALETDPTIPIVDEVPEFATVLTKQTLDNLRLSTKLFQDQTHTSVLPMALTDGLRVVYHPD